MVFAETVTFSPLTGNRLNTHLSKHLSLNLSSVTAFLQRVMLSICENIKIAYGKDIVYQDHLATDYSSFVQAHNALRGLTRRLNTIMKSTLATNNMKCNPKGVCM